MMVVQQAPKGIEDDGIGYICEIKTGSSCTYMPNGNKQFHKDLSVISQRGRFVHI